MWSQLVQTDKRIYMSGKTLTQPQSSTFLSNCDSCGPIQMHKAAPQWVVWSQLVQTDKRIYMSGMPSLMTALL